MRQSLHYRHFYDQANAEAEAKRIMGVWRVTASWVRRCSRCDGWLVVVSLVKKWFDNTDLGNPMWTGVPNGLCPDQDPLFKAAEDPALIVK